MNMKVPQMRVDVELPEGVAAAVQESTLTMKGKRGEVSRDFQSPKVELRAEDGRVIIVAKDATKREKTTLGTIRAHIRNMVRGVDEGHTYRLKICSGHFPMNVAVSGKEFSVKNFLGEKIPRKLQLRDNVDVKVDGQQIVVASNNKELAGQTAADIELLMRIKGRDRRIFQDGIYIIEKDGKLIEL